ncbi:cytochrome P450 [Choiromyces venosus 120613-1]|uniref:Cytochrome P450 n=1 Tax=Choiromyces venosus 120613-1 TaxID=1336337 RepID=A0A3N4JHT0_9PEZI|nr:cytochrome P450 [Choiromyces venosus 120613-1]
MSIANLLAGCAASTILLSRYTDFSAITTFLLLSSLVLTCRLFYGLVLWPKLLSPTRHLPGPSNPSFLMGNFATIREMQSGAPQVIWMRTIPNSGLLRYLGAFNMERIFPTTPEMLKEVLHTKSYSFIKPPLLTKDVGNIFGTKGLLFAEGEVHKLQRKLMLPAFSHAHIKGLVPGFWSKGMEMTEKVAEVVRASGDGGEEGVVVEMGKWFSLATLDIIGSSGFGYEFRALESASISGSDTTVENSGSELADAYNTIFNMGSPSRNVAILSMIFPPWLINSLPLKRIRDVAQASLTIKRVTAQIIATKKSAMAATPITSSEDSESKDILSIMLKSNTYTGPDGESSMRDQMMTFLAAGHETTATSMIWAIHALSLPENRHIQSRLRAEIHAAFPSGAPETITYDQLSTLKYLSHVTSEVLRLYPPVAVTLRVAAEDTSLNGVFVPKGSYVVLSPFAINHSVALWGADAEEFRPERWAGGEDGTAAVESNYGFLTFLAGPRGCIGNVFAKVEFKCLLAATIGKFEFEQDGKREIVVKGGITAKPQGGLPVTVKEVVWG